MATKTTWISEGAEWVFEEGKIAMFTPRREWQQKPADFRVLKVLGPNDVLTDLRGVSRYNWVGPLLTWAGDAKYEPDEPSGTGDKTSAAEEA